jgi:3-oxoadipate enol-lactonase
MPHVEVNGFSMYYEEQGEGPPLLFIAGLGAHSGSWVLVTPAFAKQFRCIAFDNRGAGRSAVPAGPWAIEQMADDTAGLLDALGIESADCIGVSLGSSVLQALCYRHPAKVRRAAMVAAFPSYTPLQSAWLDSILAMRRAGVDGDTIALSGMPWVFTPRLMAQHPQALKFAELRKQDAYPISNEGFEAQAAAIRVFDSRPRLPEVQAEVLVLTGAEDVLTPVHQAIEIASLIPNAHLKVLPRGGHGMTAEYMDDVIRAIRDFFRDVPAPGR